VCLSPKLYQKIEKLWGEFSNPNSSAKAATGLRYIRLSPERVAELDAI